MKQQITKNAIRESFLRLLAQRSFDKITVKSIVEDCGLTRNTFYYYYEDTYDILDDILTQEILKYSKLASEGADIRALTRDFCRFAEENQALVSHVLKSTKWDELKKYVQRALEKCVDIMIDEAAAGRELDPEKRGIIKTVYRSAAGGLVETWFNRGGIKDLSTKIDVLNELFGDCIARAVEKSFSDK